jgi:hypothetical protein
MASISQVYNRLQPFEQKELMQLILQGAEINEREMVLGIRTGACVGASEAPRENGATKGKLRFEPPKWLPAPVSHRTFRHSFKCHLPSLIQLRNRETNHRIKQGTHKGVAQWRRLLDDGVVKNRAELARREGLSRARITRAFQHT